MVSKEFLASAAVGVAAWYVIWRKARRAATSWVAGEEWAAKREKFATLTADNLLVITDFDATLTTGDSQQCHDVMGESPLLPEEFRAEFAPLLDWESNAAIDGVEWWDAAHGFMVKHATPRRSIIPRLVREARMTFRPGALEMLKRLEDLHIPVLIVSAGLTDVIEEFLRQHGALSENVTICSNRLNYAADTVPKSVAPDPPITSFTKEYAYSSASAFFAEHTKRRAIVQLGDSVTDVDPARHVPYEQLLSIGFVNARPDPTKHYATFDAVVHGNAGSLLPLEELLEEIAPAPTLIRSLSRAMSMQSLARLASAPGSPTAPAA